MIKDEKQDGFDNMIEACEIFRKYNDQKYAPFHCVHDILYVCGVEPDEVSEEDKERLDELGFIVREEPSKSFISYRFGSC